MTATLDEEKAKHRKDTNDAFDYGMGGPREADVNLNWAQGRIIAAYAKNGECWIGKLNVRETDPKDENGVFYSKYDREQGVGIFGADFVVPTRDQELYDLLKQWTDGKVSLSLLEKINARIAAIQGVGLVWS